MEIKKIIQTNNSNFILYATPVFVKAIAIVELGRQTIQTGELYVKTTIIFMKFMGTVKLLLIINFYTYFGRYKVE